MQVPENYGRLTEFLRYGIVGTTTTIINTYTYHILARMLGIHYLVSTIAAWVVAVLFAFFANKLFVFRQKDMAANVVAKEFVSFITARLATGVLDVVIMWLGVSILHQNDLIIKIISNVIVIILNYVLGKFLVFKEK
ncbi:GtrA family protein [Clostridiales bacterium COT073_COT-073]|nr:GtrA family protein [Clostridiales bacterium COT073_COT-073]